MMSDCLEEGLADEAESCCDTATETEQINYSVEVINKRRATSERIEGALNGYFTPQEPGKKRRRPGKLARQLLRERTAE